MEPMRLEHKDLWKVVVGVAVATMASPAWAGSGAQRLAEQHQGTVGYLSGGVGKEEAKAIEQQLGQHRLAISLLEQSGKEREFTANARIRIYDKRGRTVLDTTADGPFLLVDLPAGRYAVEASLGRSTLEKKGIAISGRTPAKADFEFPAHAG